MRGIIVFDLDGTAVEAENDVVVTKQTANAIKARLADDYILIAATSRRYSYAKEILTSLGLVHTCICAGGAQLVDPKKQEVIEQVAITNDSFDALFDRLAKTPYDIRVSTGEDAIKLDLTKRPTFDVVALYIVNVLPQDAEQIAKEIETIGGVYCHIMKTRAWGYDDEAFRTLDVGNIDATKGHALAKVIEQYNAQNAHITAIGDGNNDLPILEIADTKVVVDTAPKELIDIADTIIEPPSKEGFSDYLNDLG